MSDQINEGFGTSAPVILTAANNDLTVRYVQAPPDGFVRIRAIEFAVAQLSGAVALNAVIPFFVLRGAANLGVSASNGQLGVPLRPLGGVLPGLPDVSQIGGGLELLLASYINSRSGRGLIFPSDEEYHADLVARDSQKLAVCVGSLIDVSVSPPVVGPGTYGATLTVLGSQGKRSKKTASIIGVGDTASLPRYDISHADPNDRDSD